jgi:parallel beta-helix repeat protein
MEPKSIAFYTAVAVSILAVLSATTFPTMAQAQQQTQEEAQQTDQENNDDTTAGDSQSETMETTEAEEEEEGSEANDNEDGETNNDPAGSESLGLSSDNGRVTCGQIITEPNMEVSLTGDLNCGDQDGLIVNAPGVHVLLNGYKILGNADEESSTQGPTVDYDGSTGILVNADDVIVSGLGEVSGFDRGITFMGSSNGQLTDVQVANNGIGVLVSSSEGVEISRNTITNNDIAIILDSTSGVVIAFNQIVGNRENGIVLIGSDGSTIAANNMFGNGENGIYLDILSNDNTVDYNTVFGHEMADMNNAGGQPTNVNQNSFGDNNNCGTSHPGGLCR